MNPGHHDHIQVYRDIAAEYGVDPTDQEAVLHFFRETLQNLPERESVLERIHETNPSGIGGALDDTPSLDSNTTQQNILDVDLPTSPETENS